MKRISLALVALVVVLVVASAAFASGGGEHHVPWGNFIFRWINFVIFVAIIWWAAGAKIKDFFVGRQEQIKKGLDDLESRKAEAEKKLRQVEDSIKNIDKEKAAILAEAEKQGEDLKAAIIAKAEESAEKIRVQAKASGEQEAKVAVEQLKAEMAEQIMAAAQKMLEDKLSADDHAKLVDDYLTKVVLN